MTKKTKKSKLLSPEQMAESLYNSPTMRKMFRAQLAACVFPATPTNFAESSLERRVAASLQIADKILNLA